MRRRRMRPHNHGRRRTLAYYALRSEEPVTKNIGGPIAQLPEYLQSAVDRFVRERNFSEPDGILSPVSLSLTCNVLSVSEPALHPLNDGTGFSHEEPGGEDVTGYAVD